jgi:ubiquinone/menaquinone biosynthesis C-methylase UbiE
MTNPSLPQPLHTQNPLDRFSNRAQDYAKYRPSYPSEAIDLIVQGLGEPSRLVVADVGAGTGISARLMADRGATVWAIEPNAAMRAAAAPHALVVFRDGTAEQTGLPNQSVDLVLCCQSFHWFNKPVALAEFHRILKPHGRVALMWNDRNLDDPFTQQYSTIVGKVADRQIFDQADRKSGAALEQSRWFTNFRAHTPLYTHRLTWEELIGLVRSSSYVPKSGELYEQLRIALQELYQRWADADRVQLSYRVNLYLADRHPIL